MFGPRSHFQLSRTSSDGLPNSPSRFHNAVSVSPCFPPLTQCCNSAWTSQSVFSGIEHNPPRLSKHLNHFNGNFTKKKLSHSESKDVCLANIDIISKTFDVDSADRHYTFQPISQFISILTTHREKWL